MPDLSPLTFRGRLLLVLGAAALCYGLFTSDIALTKMSLACILMLLTARILAGVNLRNVSCSKEMPSLVRQGEQFPLKISVSNSKGVMHAFDVLAIDHLAQGMSAENFRFTGIGPESEGIGCKTGGLKHRGTFGPSEYVLSSRFPLGLAHSSVTGILPDTISVYPSPRLPFDLQKLLETGMDQGSVQRGPTHDITTDFRSMREYRSGDHRKLISWPVSVRLQKLVVKEMESPCPAEVFVVYHSFLPPRAVLPERSFERSLHLLSGLVCGLFDSSTPFSFTASFNGWQRVAVPPGSPEFREILLSLAVARMAAATNMNDVSRIIAEEAARPQTILVISNTPVNYWRELLPPAPVPVICIDNHTAWSASTAETLCAY